MKIWESLPTAIHLHASLHVVGQPNAEIEKIARYLFVFLAMSKKQKIWNLDRTSPQAGPDTGTETKNTYKEKSCSKVGNRSSKWASQLASQAGSKPSNQAYRHRQADDPPARKNQAKTETNRHIESAMQSAKHELCWSHCLLAGNGFQKCNSNEKPVGVGMHATHACNKRRHNLKQWIQRRKSKGSQFFFEIRKKPGLSKARASFITTFFSWTIKSPPSW